MKKYYLYDGIAQQGPFDLDELRSKNISPEISVWFDPMPGWKPAGDVPELQSLFFHAPPAFHDTIVPVTEVTEQPIVAAPIADVMTQEIVTEPVIVEEPVLTEPLVVSEVAPVVTTPEPIILPPEPGVLSTGPLVTSTEPVITSTTPIAATVSAAPIVTPVRR